MTLGSGPNQDRSPFLPYYRLGVGLMIINHNRQIFTGKRIDSASQNHHNEGWQMPQGGIDYNETPYEAALREMKEEIGTAHVQLIKESSNWYTYDLPKDLAEVLWGGRFDGQKQKWFLFNYLGNDCDINIHTRHPEFLEWKWMAPDDLQQTIVPFKKALYTEIIKEFSPFL